ncbi:GNAT family N-acetyltransferase [Scandinavium sp. H11S7]|uniref:GNAT family N-acetyltransferase n=1 Tax=Scandinavium hiltneri TaxID=2926519 RepID=UPI002166B541|nr:GNAT family N-acetyltransferase [Scandinavium hiltneri]MCS2158748.1 GNAT family N-acetyltransferase [Scandinavium hiltneri]
MMQISLRIATNADLAIVNERYAEIDFVPSLAGELIVLATDGDNIVGQGRVVTIDTESGELGGIYVFPGNEGLRIARKVVDFLIKNSGLSVLYCLPFAELEGFYGSMGFGTVKDIEKIPPAVIKKHEWCLSNYDKTVLLLSKEMNVCRYSD